MHVKGYDCANIGPICMLRLNAIRTVCDNAHARWGGVYTRLDGSWYLHDLIQMVTRCWFVSVTAKIKAGLARGSASGMTLRSYSSRLFIESTSSWTYTLQSFRNLFSIGWVHQLTLKRSDEHPFQYMSYIT